MFSFWCVVEWLYMVQLLFSVVICKFEDEVGVVLFECDNCGLWFMLVGEVFLFEVWCMFEQVECVVVVVCCVGVGFGGMLWLCFVDSIVNVLLLLILWVFQEWYLNVDFQFEEGMIVEQVFVLCQDCIDVGFVVLLVVDVGDVYVELLLCDWMVVVLFDGYWFVCCCCVVLVELVDELWVMFVVYYGFGMYVLIVMVCVQVGFVLWVVQQLCQMQMMVGFVVGGIGVVLMLCLFVLMQL